MSDTFYTDRSRIQTYQRCPFLRYIEYHWDGIGVVPDKVAVPLATGGSIHVGNQRLFEGASEDEAVQDAVSCYKEMVSKAGFQDTRDHNQEYLIAEQIALTEVMVRAWARKRLPLFKEHYNIIEIERESPPAVLAPGIEMLRRPDGVLENNSTFFYETLSFKTAKQYTSKNDRANMKDIQGISETWAVAQQYGEEKVGPVVMEFLVTGPRKKVGAEEEDDKPIDVLTNWEDEDVMIFDSNAPTMYQMNPLIRAWRDQYGNVSWKYKLDEGQVLLGGDALPEHCKDGKGATMAKFFNPYYGKKPSKKLPEIPKYEVKSFAVWEEMPVKEWFEKMYANQIFPQWLDPFENMFIIRKYNRMPFELSEWQREAAAQEMEIRRALEILNNPLVDQATKDSWKARVFPKYRHSCEYPTHCKGNPICWQGVVDPLSAGFRYRTPNHPQELKK